MESKILLKFVTHNYCIYGKYIISSNFSVLSDIFYRSREPYVLWDHYPLGVLDFGNEIPKGEFQMAPN